MKTFLLATVSIVALTSVARTAEMPDNARPFSSIPVAHWNAGHIGVQGGVAYKDALSKESIGAFSAPFLRDGSRTGHIISAPLGYNSLAAARTQAGPHRLQRYPTPLARSGPQPS